MRTLLAMIVTEEGCEGLMRIFGILLLLVVSSGCVNKYHRLFAYEDTRCRMYAQSQHEFDSCMSQLGCNNRMSEKICGRMVKRNAPRKRVKKALSDGYSTALWKQYKKEKRAALKAAKNRHPVSIRPDRRVRP